MIFVQNIAQIERRPFAQRRMQTAGEAQGQMVRRGEFTQDRSIKPEMRPHDRIERLEQGLLGGEYQRGEAIRREAGLVIQQGRSVFDSAIFTRAACARGAA